MRVAALVLTIAAGTLGAALAMAALSHRWVELPTIAIGQKWSQAAPQPGPDLPRPRMS